MLHKEFALCIITDFEKATKCFDTVLKFDPKIWLAELGIGIALGGMNEHDKAQIYIDDVLFRYFGIEKSHRTNG